MKILALDIGDVHIGIAITDEPYIFAQPLKTVHSKDLDQELQILFKQHTIKTVVVGYPKTMSGKESAQTKIVVEHKNQLEQKFTNCTWVLWDERLTSKQATFISSQNKRKKTPENKSKQHAIAAAIFLQTYIDYITQYTPASPSNYQE